MNQPLDLVAIRLAVDLDLFNVLANSQAPKSVQLLAEETRADPTLLGRILRCLASFDAVADAGPELYIATKISRAFTTTKGISGAGLLYVPAVTFALSYLTKTCSVDCVMPIWSALPATLAKSHYQNPSDNLHTALQSGLRTDEHGFQWFAKHPKALNDFNIFLSAQREGRACWLDFYPFEHKLSAEARGDEHDILFVDVGGALGSEIRELRRRYPALKGRMILQDMQQTIDHVSANPAMEAMVHDFFTPQPVIGTFFAPKPPSMCCSKHSPCPGHGIFPPLNARNITTFFLALIPNENRLKPSLTGARFYYLRNVLHNWPEPLARLILQQIRSAMTPSMSRLLINELVVPLQGGGLFASHSDFNMMSTAAGMERTEAQWKELLTSAGLEVEEIWNGEGETESIIEAVVAPRNGHEPTSEM